MVVELGDWDLGEGVSEIRAQRRKKTFRREAAECEFENEMPWSCWCDCFVGKPNLVFTSVQNKTFSDKRVGMFPHEMQ